MLVLRPDIEDMPGVDPVVTRSFLNVIFTFPENRSLTLPILFYVRFVKL